MKLGERVKQASEPLDLSLLEAPQASEESHIADVKMTAALLESETFSELKAKVQEALLLTLGNRVGEPDMDDDELKKLAVAEMSKVLEAEDMPLSVEERDRLVDVINADLLGYGPIQPLLADPSVSEIMVNGTKSIYVEKNGRLTQADIRFSDETSLRKVINRIVAPLGRRIDESSPMVDARLPDGSRVCAVIPPLAVDGSSLTVRKFAVKQFTAEDLIENSSASIESLYMIAACVHAKLNILVSGGTGSGKTTLLNVLSSFIPEGDRIVTIEDVVELQLRQHHVIRLETRPGNAEGKGEIAIRDLVRTSLRMRPDRIVVGECRGGEALDMLQAMNTGHAGSLSTLHANTPRDAMTRLETMVLMAGIDFPMAAIRQQIAGAVDVVVQIGRLRDGSRRVTSICEVGRVRGDEIEVTPVFDFDHSPGFDADGKVLGSLKPTGYRPVFVDHIHDMGIEFEERIFGGDK
ncbi:CpaF family protein [Actinospongicola halichondriae]|uniref:CpaF family protein n=1 Tax=Actinospongicola halichondriae TaxID=3236844 RepID=UPI003D58C630